MANLKPKRITIADVAAAAGVSRTTVSHALNGIGQVDPRTRAKVKAVAAELNYRPSVRAQRLRSGKSQTLALLSSMSAAVSAGPSQLGFFTELAMGCAQTALLRGYFLVLAPPLDGASPVSGLDIDGAIVLEPAPADRLIEELSARGTPFVVIDDDEGANASGALAAVSLHHEHTSRLLLEHLRDEGASAVGLVVGSSGRRSQEIFARTYSELTAEWGQDPWIATSAEDGGEQAGYEATKHLLRDHPEIDALCVPIDAFAVGAVRAAKDLGRTVGEDLLIATRYNGIRAQTSNPALTCVDLRLHEVSGLAVDLLLNAMGENGGEQERPGQPPALIIRESTAGGRR